MTDPTPEQHAAWKNLQDELRREDLPVIGFSLAVLAPLLPDALTNPKPVLPTEPGRYQDRSGNDGWELHFSGKWLYNRQLTPEYAGLDAHDYAPFVRLVPERPKVTADQVRHILSALAPLPSEINRLVALANGEPE